VIDGTAGVGKTALAVHWAHRAAARFPDGQLYVNLRGFDPSAAPVAPGEAVRGFLDAFEVPPDRVPDGVAAQAGLYRSLLAGRRVLVLLDNAADAEQVRPLLPGAPGCAALVTSRSQLTGLVAGAGAHPLTLGLPTAAEARDMLAGRLGRDRLAAEPRAVDGIVAACARLPLALAIVAARAAGHPGFDLAALAGELRATRGGLDEFAGDDLATDVRAVFSWSYRRLSPAAAALFRLLGLHPGPDVGRPAAASLAGVPRGTARRLLAELARAHMVAEPGPGRYACHDLLRAYAAELAAGTDAEPARAAAAERLLAHYVHTADQADRLLNPHRDDPVALSPPPPGAQPEPLAGREEALAWFAAELPVLVAAVRGAIGPGDAAGDAERWRLAWSLTRYFSYRGRWHDSVDALSAALQAARLLADPVRQAVAHQLLGCAYVQLGRYPEADAELRAALAAYRGLGDAAGQAHTHRHCAWMLERQQRPAEALDHAQRALDLFRAAGDLRGQARALNAVGWFQAVFGDHEQAIASCRRALELQQEVGDRFGQAEIWDSLGYIQHRLGRHADAVRCYRTAVELYREFDDRYNEADSLAALGDAHSAAGDRAQADTAWRAALELLERLDHPDAARLRGKLSQLSDYDPVAR
jgi:tetratricopeptide (TPR) repeat protein